VSRYNGRKFLNYTKKDGLLNNKNNSVVFTDSKNNIWIGGESGIVLNKEGIFSTLTFENKELIGNKINEIIEDSKGNIWIGTSSGITVINENKTIHISKKNGLNSNFIKAILEDKDGNYLIGSANGIDKIIAGSLFNSTLEFDNSLFKDIDASVTDLILDKEKNIWITTKGDGAYLIKNSNQISHISKKKWTNHQ
jgi:ligand-binding sensor domain-containing protein